MEENVVVSGEDIKKRIHGVLNNLLKELVDHPEKLEVKFWSGEQTTVFEVTCEKADLGKLIGKQGRTVSAIREVLRVISGKNKLRAILDVKE